MTPSRRALAEYAYPDIKTERGLLNVCYRQRALGILQSAADPQRFAWLCDVKKMTGGEADAWQPTILSELGKIADCDALEALALELCELKPKTRAAVALVKRARFGLPRGDSEQLALELLRAINDYITRRETSYNEILEALYLARFAVEETQREKENDGETLTRAG